MSAIENFFAGLKSDTELMFSINTALAKRCDPYVPFREGYLSDVNITKTGVSYNQPYAHYQYTGIVYGPNYPIHAKGDSKTIIGFYTPAGMQKYPVPGFYGDGQLRYDQSVHPYAGPEWDKRMMEAEGDKFLADCQQLVDKRVNVFNKIHALNW